MRRASPLQTTINPQPMVKCIAEPHKRHRHAKHKAADRVKNWREYDRVLRDRGDITLWITQEATHQDFRAGKT